MKPSAWDAAGVSTPALPGPTKPSMWMETWCTGQLKNRRKKNWNKKRPRTFPSKFKKTYSLNFSTLYFTMKNMKRLNNIYRKISLHALHGFKN
jgi:hypothetical protein